MAKPLERSNERPNLSGGDAQTSTNFLANRSADSPLTNSRLTDTVRHWNVPAPRRDMTVNALTIGLIGAGRIGVYHAGLLASMPEVRALLIGDVVPGRAEEVAGTIPKAKPIAVGEIMGLVDGVLIASSTDTHAELLMAAAHAGVTVFCEKPIALDLPTTKAAVAAVDKSGITVQMGFQRRYDPAMKSIQVKVASGELGTPYLVRSQTHDPEPPPLDYIPSSGGIFRDCLIHDIDIVRYVTGQDVVSVTAAGTNVGHPKIAELGDMATVTAILTMSGGTIAQLSGMRRDPVGYDVRLEAFGPGGAVAAGWSDRSPITSAEPGVLPPSDPIVTFWDRFDAAYHAELEAFIRVIAGTEAPASTHHDAYQDLRVATACDRAAKEGRSVSMEEIE